MWLGVVARSLGDDVGKVIEGVAGLSATSLEQLGRGGAVLVEVQAWRAEHGGRWPSQESADAREREVAMKTKSLAEKLSRAKVQEWVARGSAAWKALLVEVPGVAAAPVFFDGTCEIEARAGAWAAVPLEGCAENVAEPVATMDTTDDVEERQGVVSGGAPKRKRKATQAELAGQDRAAPAESEVPAPVNRPAGGVQTRSMARAHRQRRIAQEELLEAVRQVLQSMTWMACPCGSCAAN